MRKKKLKEQKKYIFELEEKNKELCIQIKNMVQEKLSDELRLMELTEESKSAALDAIFITKDILESIKILTSDIKVLKKDLKIGGLTMEDRINTFCYELKTFTTKLHQIKDTLYSKNNLKENP